MSGLNKEVWISQIMERYYPDASFLKYAKDYSQFVENDKINMADAGIDPDILINNTTYPIEVVQRVDTPLSFELDKFETTNTLVRHPDVVERAYDMLESVIVGHRETLRSGTGAKAAHAYAPGSNSTYTPVIKTTGASTGEGGRLRLLPEDIVTLKTKYDIAEMPTENRFLVLHPYHVEDLILADLNAFKNIVDLKNGEPNTFAGFKILQYTRTAKYNPSTLVKNAFNSVGGNFSSFAFISDEVMKAAGTLEMYATVKDPRERATIVGFEQRFIGLPIRNKGNGAIVSADAA